jgi:serine/threonine protein phosphatase PrpC
MEDAHFDIPVVEGRLIGIFDGHGEKGRIAKQVSEYFQKHFEEELKKRPEDIRKVYIDLCKGVQEEIKDPTGGTCALVVYFHSVSNRFYTATLGDSEMRIYRKAGDEIFSIPVSLVRNWKSPKDEARFLEVMDIQMLRDVWLRIEEPKYRRFPHLPGFPTGINTSRSLGDLRMRHNGKTAVSIKPKVSMAQAVLDDEVQDRIIFACDGLWDFMSDERVFIDTILKPHWDNPQLAEVIVDYAIQTCKSTDNVTVMVGILSNEMPQELPATLPLDLE